MKTYSKATIESIRLLDLVICAFMLLADLRLPRRMANIVGILLCLLFFVLKEGMEAELAIHKISYLILTIALEMPWVITVISFGILREIELRESGRIEEDGEDDCQR